MIDTIVMRIHEYKNKYQHYGIHLQNISEPDKTKIRYSGKSSFKDDLQNFQFYADTRSNRFLSIFHGVHNVSSHYTISFSQNFERDYLEINMSIPKYFFGTNVFQFTDHRDIDINHIWTKFEKFLHEFFSIYFPTPPDYHDVEVNRIDFCLNQIFDSKADALKYLARQKELNVAYARSERNRFNDYGSTTIQYVTKNYSFKVYHKGTEFRKNDLNELKKLYHQNTGKIYNEDSTYVKINGLDYELGHISNVADRTLRYELTFRKGGLNYVFKQHVMNDENTMVNHHAKRMLKTNIRSVRKYVQDDMINVSYQFRLQTVWDMYIPAVVDLVKSHEFTFSFELFYRLHDFFMERVNRYQLDKKLTITEMYEKIKESNEKKKVLKKESDNINQLVLIATLSQYTNIDDLKSIIPKRTFYRYKKKLKEAEISYQSIDDIYAPPLDFAKYFDELGNYHVKFN